MENEASVSGRVVFATRQNLRWGKGIAIALEFEGYAEVIATPSKVLYRA